MAEIDARGFGCPIPVVKTKKVMEDSPGVQIAVLVGAAGAKENVSRLAQSRNYSVEVEEMAGGEYRLLLTPAKK
ncbi:MAG: sulfurtransferase TusA family protein [Syntrophales bacterium]